MSPEKRPRHPSKKLQKRRGRRPQAIRHIEDYLGSLPPELVGASKAIAFTGDWLPYKPLLLRSLLRALIAAIAKEDARKARWMKWMIHLIHIQTYNEPNTQLTSELTKTAQDLLRQLASGRPNRESHSRLILQCQRAVLLGLMKKYRYPVYSDMHHGYWLYDHRNEIYEELAHWPCFCGSYPSSLHAPIPYDDDVLLDKKERLSNKKQLKRKQAIEAARMAKVEFRGEWSEKNNYELPEMQAVYRILAFFHHTTPGQIENLLETIPYSIRRKRKR